MMFASVFLIITLISFKIVLTLVMSNMQILPEHTTVFTVPTPLVLYRIHVHLFLSYFSIHSAPVHSSLPRLVLPPANIT